MELSELPPNDKILFLDIETESGVDLTAEGVGRYFADPFTRITVIGVAVGKNGEVGAMDWTKHQMDVKALIADADMLVAHNATFDFLGLNIMQDYTDKRLCCTRAMCALANMPEGLKDAAEAINTEFKKLETPELLQTGQAAVFDYANATDDQKEKFLEYTRMDVAAMREIFYNLIEGTPAHELDAIDAHIRVNMRGMPLDREALDEAHKETKEEKEQMAVDFKVRYGMNISQVDKIKDYINQKYKMDVEQEKSPLLGTVAVDDPDIHSKFKLKSGSAAALSAVREFLDEDDQQMIDMRLSLSQNEHAKLDKIKKRADGMDPMGTCYTLRDELVFAKAVTGRWSSKGAQMHNNRRGGRVKQLVVAPRGWSLFVSDFSQVELRIALWVAGALDAVKEIHKGKFYEEVAGRVYNKSPEEVSKDERFMGKQLALGCNYGMGAERFVATCKGYGVDVPLKEAERLVRLYRQDILPQLPNCWEQLQQAALQTMRTGKKAVPDGTRGVWFHYKGGPLELLEVRLPTGRSIRYWNARVGEDDWGNPLIEYFDPGSPGKKPTISNGGHWLENLSQAISRDMMARSLVRFGKEDASLLRVIMHVHDELVALVKKKSEYDDLAKLEELMLDPKFTDGDGVNGLLLAVESHLVKRWGDAK